MIPTNPKDRAIGVLSLAVAKMRHDGLSLADIRAALNIAYDDVQWQMHKPAAQQMLTSVVETMRDEWPDGRVRELLREAAASIAPVEPAPVPPLATVPLDVLEAGWWLQRVMQKSQITVLHREGTRLTGIQCHLGNGNFSERIERGRLNAWCEEGMLASPFYNGPWRKVTPDIKPEPEPEPEPLVDLFDEDPPGEGVRGLPESLARECQARAKAAGKRLVIRKHEPKS